MLLERVRLDEPLPLAQRAAIAKFRRQMAEGKLPPPAKRTAEERRKYAGDPWRYFSDILAWILTKQQEEALAFIEKYNRVLLPGGNNLGKSELGAGYAVYRMDAVAALPDEEYGLEEQGAQILLPGPDAKTVFATIYSKMMTHAARAELRGFKMPGYRSEKSVLWRVRSKWFVEAFHPPKTVGQNVRHTASGRHHKNQIALIEEGQGVGDPIWRGAEGMCSAEGNKIISPFNPTEDIGPASQRARGGSYHVLTLSAFDHPNVIERKEVVPAAISHLVIDERVRNDCRDRGAFPGVLPDEHLGDFLYALPTLGEPEVGARTDNVRGHPAAAVHVYRPTGLFEPQVFGRYPRSSSNMLCDSASWDAAVERGKKRMVPSTPPDRVGLDAAREGADDPCAVPSWGPDAETLLREHGERVRYGKLDEAIRRTLVGMPVILPKGDGPDLARAVHVMFPASSINVDEGGVGSSSFDHLYRVLAQDSGGVSFGSAGTKDPLPGFEICENLRTEMYVYAARCVIVGLVDLPDDPLLREEFLAHWLIRTKEDGTDRARVVDVHDPNRGPIKERKPSVILAPKKKIKEKIGRSPDRADGFVLSLYACPIGSRNSYISGMAPGGRQDSRITNPTHPMYGFNARRGR